MRKKPIFTDEARVIAAYIFVILFPSSLTAEIALQIKGTITQEHSKAGFTLFRIQDSFEVLVGMQSMKWKVTLMCENAIRQNKPKSDLVGRYTIATTDGANFYHLTKFSKALQTSRNVGQGALGSGTIPYGQVDPKITALWFAYASAAYFRTNSDSYIPALFGEQDIENLSRDCRVKGSYSLSGHQPAVPVHIDFGLCKRYQLDPEHTGPACLSPFTNVVYKAMDMMDFGIYKVPSAFTYQVYIITNLPDAKGLYSTLNGDDGGKISGIVASATVVRDAEVGVAPEITGPTTMSDIRHQTLTKSIGVGLGQVAQWPNKPTRSNSP
jgi:hypothetical protein